MSSYETAIVYAPAASNYGDKVHQIVYQSAIVSGKPRGTLAVDGSKMPLGVIIEAADELGGRLVVQLNGRGRVRAGGVVTPGTNFQVMSDASAKAIVALDGNFVLGRAVQEFVTAADDLMEVVIQPAYLENT